MAIKVMNFVWEQELPPHLKYVAVALADHAHEDGTEARPSQEYLAAKTGLSVRQIRRSLHSLVDAGVIVVQRPSGRNRPVCYAFVLAATDGRKSRNDGRSQDTDGRSHTTIKAAASDHLTIRTVIENIGEVPDSEKLADRETAISFIKQARANLSRRQRDE